MTTVSALGKTKEVHATRSSRVAQQIRLAIENGAYPPGSLLPGRRVLVQEYHVSLATIEMAIRSLVADGYLRAENGRGTFVLDVMGGSNERLARTSDVPRAVAASDAPLVLGIVSFLHPQYDETHPHTRRFAAIVIEAFERSVTAKGGITHFFNTYDHPQTPEFIREATTKLVDEYGIKGVIIAMPRFQVDVFQAARISPIPTVVVENQYSPAAVRQIYYGARQDGYRAASVLIRNGSDRLVYFAPYRGEWVDERQAGVFDAAASGSISVVTYVEPREEAERHLEDQQEVARRYAVTVPIETIRGAGIVACNDAAAAAVIEHALGHGLVAGVDYSIVGFDDSFVARDIGLATFRPPLTLMGEKAAEMLSQLAHGQDPPMSVCLNSDFVMRRSIRQSAVEFALAPEYAAVGAALV